MSRSSRSARPPADEEGGSRAGYLFAGIAALVLVGVVALVLLDEPPPAPGGACAPLAVSTVPLPPMSTGRAVSVFWDGSGSMRTYAGGLRRVVEVLDSTVLQNAGATALRHYVVGDTVSADVRRATEATARFAGDSSLQTAARVAGEALVRGEAQAVLFVSDMHVEIPRRLLDQGGIVCPDVPMPSTPEAGATFSRCLESALLGKSTGDETLPPAATPELFITSFDASPSPGGELHVLLVSLDPAFGSVISSELGRQLGGEFVEHRVADTRENLPGTAACTWQEGDLGAVERSANAKDTCQFTCMDTTRAALRCSVPLAGPGTAWIAPALPTLVVTGRDGDRFNGAVDASGTVSLGMGCGRQVHGGQAGRRAVSLTVGRGWVSRPDVAAVSGLPNVQELYRALAAMALGRAPERATTLSVQLEDNQ